MLIDFYARLQTFNEAHCILPYMNVSALKKIDNK